MSILTKLFRRQQEQQAPSAPGGAKTYREKDNLGMRQDSAEKAVAYWMGERLRKERKDPFVLSAFSREADARAALLDLPCIHEAADTKNLICTRTLIFGVYRQDDGTYEAIICGDDLTLDLWQHARDSFAKHGGKLKNELEPEQRAAAPPTKTAQPGKVKFLREERKTGPGGLTMTYRIHKGPDGASAQAFLQEHPVTQRLLYLIVETPEGNYGRDVDGVYKE